MRNLALFSGVFLLLASPVWAICFSSDTLDVWPPAGDELAPNGVVLLTGEMRAGTMADLLRRCPPFLVGFQERIALRVSRIEDPYRIGARAVLEPSRWLRPDADYYLELHGFTAEQADRLRLTSGWPLPGRDAPHWRTARSPDWVAPTWTGVPQIEEVSSAQHGCGPDVRFIVKTPVADDRPGVAVLATVQPLVTWFDGRPAFGVEFPEPWWSEPIVDDSWTPRVRPYGEEVWWRSLDPALPISCPAPPTIRDRTWSMAEADQLEVNPGWAYHSVPLPSPGLPSQRHDVEWFQAFAAGHAHGREPLVDQPAEYLRSLIVEVADGRIDLGHAMCGGAFDLVPGRSYRVWLDAIDRAGNRTPAPRSLEITWPVNDWDRARAQARGAPPNFDYE